MKRWNKIYTLYIEAVLALIAIAMGIMCFRYSSGERNNLKAVQKAENAPEEARMHLKKAVKLNPQNPVIHLNLGLLYSSEDEGRFMDYLLQQIGFHLSGRGRDAYAEDRPALRESIFRLSVLHVSLCPVYSRHIREHPDST